MPPLVTHSSEFFTDRSLRLLSEFIFEVPYLPLVNGPSLQKTNEDVYTDICVCLKLIYTLAQVQAGPLLDPRPYQRAWRRIVAGRIRFDVACQHHLVRQEGDAEYFTITLSNTFREEIRPHYATGIFLLARLAQGQSIGTPRPGLQETLGRHVFYKKLFETFPEIPMTASQRGCLEIEGLV